MNQLRVILLAFLSPGQAFARILAKPRVIIALLLLWISAIAAHAVLCHKFDKEAMVRATAVELAEEEGGKEPPESDVQKEAVRRLNMKRIFGYVAIFMMIPLFAMGLAILFWFLCRFSKNKQGFKKCYSVAAHVWLPTAIRSGLALIVFLDYPSIDPLAAQGLFRTNLGDLLGRSSVIPGLFLVDPFLIWMGVLFGVAGRVAGWGWLKVICGGVGAWLVVGFSSRLLF
ncbi:MAG: YIP1 family protein [Deltaproteobacteria bacterium]|nr:YIP1 family protein [Deltaproteobacteria bacterium]MBW1872079.1 YIP1 family protein [Deltaproteobacteria bacterium]